MNNSSKNLKTVADEGHCVGCGMCAFAVDKSMKLNRYGEFIPEIDFHSLSSTDAQRCENLCPSLNPQQDENFIGKQFFGNHGADHDSKIGFALSSYAGFAIEDTYRANGTSGGMASWIAVELLKRGHVNSVIHVKESERTNSSDPFYSYTVSDSIEEARAGSKTKYHATHLLDVLRVVSKSEKKFLFIGVPCFVKALRRLQISDSVFREKIPFAISLVCGHMKSVNWSISLGWGSKISPADIDNIQYRTKGSNIPARAYVFRAFTKQGYIQKDSSEVPGGSFNAGALMLRACEFCDDVVGETADLTVGDAWLPRFEVDSGGTNLLIVRNPVIEEIFKSANGISINITPLSNTEAALSQPGAFRQRREGLSYRLQREINNQRWVPSKRVSPNQFSVGFFRKKVYDLRTQVTIQSRTLFADALQSNDFNNYSENISKLSKAVRRYERLSSFPRLLKNKISRLYYSLKS